MKRRMDVAGPACAPCSLHFRSANFKRFFLAWNDRGLKLAVSQDAAINEEVLARCMQYPSQFDPFSALHEQAPKGVTFNVASQAHCEVGWKWRLLKPRDLTTGLATSISCSCQIGRRPRLVKKRIPNQRHQAGTTFFLECSAYGACERYMFNLFFCILLAFICHGLGGISDVSELPRMKHTCRIWTRNQEST